METFNEFLSEGKKLTLKRKYTESHPARTVGKTASVRNSVIEAIKDGVITKEEFTKIISELSGDHKQWKSRNKKYFNVSEDGVSLSRWGIKILGELNKSSKSRKLNEAKGDLKVGDKGVDYNDNVVEIIAIDRFAKVAKMFKKEMRADPEEYGIEELSVNTDYYFTKNIESPEASDVGAHYIYPVKYDMANYWGLDELDESVVTENYEVIYSDGVSAMKKFRSEKQALDFMYKTIDSNKKLRDIAVYKPGMYSTTQTELVVKFWGDGSYLDNVSKKDTDLAAKKLQENTNMENIFLYESFADFTASNGILNEKISSAILSNILMSGKEGKWARKNLANLAGGFYQATKVALDKIQDEDFIVSNEPQKAFKNHGGSSNIIFFISDNEKENPYTPSDASYSAMKMVPGGGTLLAAMSGDRNFYSNDWSRYSKNRAWKKDGKKGAADQIGVNKKYRGWDASGLSNGKRIAEVSDRVIIVNLDLIRQKYSTERLRSARAAAKSGAIAFKSDKDFKTENKNRYNQILATKAAALPIDKMVADAIDQLANQIKEGLAKGDKTRYEEIKIGENSKGREAKLRDASNHMSNILDNYSRYCDYIRQGEESKERYGQAESYYERESKNYAKTIKDQISKIKSFDYAW
jgi:hypothetical protein